MVTVCKLCIDVVRALCGSAPIAWCCHLVLLLLASKDKDHTNSVKHTKPYSAPIA